MTLEGWSVKLFLFAIHGSDINPAPVNQRLKYDQLGDPNNDPRTDNSSRLEWATPHINKTKNNNPLLVLYGKHSRGKPPIIAIINIIILNISPLQWGGGVRPKRVSSFGCLDEWLRPGPDLQQQLWVMMLLREHKSASPVCLEQRRKRRRRRRRQRR